MSAKIYSIDRGTSIWIWLCAAHLKQRKAQGWDIKEKGPTPAHELTCDDCTMEAAAAAAKEAAELDAASAVLEIPPAPQNQNGATTKPAAV